MFRGQIERPFKAVHILTYSDKRVTVALNPQCLHILDSKSPPVSGPHLVLQPFVLVYMCNVLLGGKMKWF